MAKLDSRDYSSDVLQPMPDADLLRYRDICAKRLPATLQVHHFLTIQHRWKHLFARPESEALTKNIAPKCKTIFYVPRNASADNCTFVAISDELLSANYNCSIYAFTLESPPTELVDCLRDTGRIDWQSGPLFEALSEPLVPVVEEMLAKKQISCQWSDTIDCVWMPKEEAIAIDVRYFGCLDHATVLGFLINLCFRIHSIPDELYFDALGECHASIINETWAYRCDTSLNYIRSILQLNGGLGLFEKSTNRILAWILINDHLAFG